VSKAAEEGVAASPEAGFFCARRREIVERGESFVSETEGDSDARSSRCRVVENKTMVVKQRWFHGEWPLGVMGRAG